tara:strand:- start:91 stop:690 length:600 start_codon:yes stop_codon:yes gene_type:complete
MPRPNRILVENGYYHVFNRANNKRGVNLSHQTFDYFCYLLGDMKKIFNISIYSYCLMTNHYHIFLQTKLKNLDKAMQYFGQRYSTYINKALNATGPVFCTRYKSKIVTEEQYLLQLLRYIHLNPVNAKLAENVLDYKWSSIQEYLKRCHQLVDTSFFLNYFINLGDFIDYHHYGNTNEFQQFYEQQKSPALINSDTICR